MSTLKKIFVLSSLIVASVNLFAVQVEGSGTAWGVKGTSTSSLNYGYLGGTWYGAFGKDSSSGNYGILGHDVYGVFGENANESWGALATNSYGAEGQHISGNFGYLGSENYGAYGLSSPGNYGYLGSSDYGAYASNTNGNYAYLGSTNYGVYASNTNGNYAYLGGLSFGVFGYAKNISTAAQFMHSNGVYANLASSTTAGSFIGSGSGRASVGCPNIGISASGSTWAASFAGDVYINGDLLVTGDKDNVIKMDDGTWVTMSATEAPYPEYTISGRAKLVNGSARVEFEEPYPQVISSQIPIKVIVTAEGSSSVIYVKDVSVKGFTAASEIGDRNATFSWMAIARVKGKEQKQDYKAVTAKMQKFEAEQKLLGLSTMNLPPSSNEVKTQGSQTIQTLPELRLSVAELSASGSVNIYYQLPEASTTTLSVYDASGRLVRTLSRAEASAGNNAISWDCTDDAGRPIPKGIYFVRLEDGADTKTAKVTILK